MWMHLERPTRPCAVVGPMSHGLPSPDVAHTQNAYAVPTLVRRRPSDHDQSDHAPTLGQRCPADHHPTSHTFKMHKLAKRWLDVNIPTATNPTMRRRWANVARPTITRRHPHSKCLGWPNVGSTSSFRPRPCADVGPTLHGRQSPDVAHTQNAYVGPTLARRRHSNHDQSDHPPTLGQR